MIEINVKGKSLGEIAELCQLGDGELDVDLEIVRLNIGVDC